MKKVLKKQPDYLPSQDLNIVPIFFKIIIITIAVLVLSFFGFFTIADIHSNFTSHSAQAKVIGFHEGSSRGTPIQHPIFEVYAPQKSKQYMTYGAEIQRTSVEQDQIIEVKYTLNQQGEIDYFRINTPFALWFLPLIATISCSVIIFFIFKNFPFNYFYWTRIQKRFQALKLNTLRAEGYVKKAQFIRMSKNSIQLQIIKLHVSVNIQQQTLQYISSEIEVSLDFKITHPKILIYIDPEHLNQFEMDIVTFLYRNCEL